MTDRGLFHLCACGTLTTHKHCKKCQHELEEAARKALAKPAVKRVRKSKVMVE